LAKTETVESTSANSPLYFDSALIAKFYLNEPGREAIRDLAKSAGAVVTSGIAVAEVSAAFHRKFREGAVDQKVFKALQGQFKHDLASGLWLLVGPTEALLEEVRALFSRLERSVFLRSLDALHLVTAKEERFKLIYSNDRHLLDACATVGLEGINPVSRVDPGPTESSVCNGQAGRAPRTRPTNSGRVLAIQSWAGVEIWPPCL
jgi:predicted nucleic acid-binding protein